MTNHCDISNIIIDEFKNKFDSYDDDKLEVIMHEVYKRYNHIPLTDRINIWSKTSKILFRAFNHLEECVTE